MLASEQKSFLVALTRADECAVMSAVLNDDHVPSDFLYGYVPEWFDRDRDADMEQREYAAIGSQGDYAGLESDPRGLIAAARSGACGGTRRTARRPVTPLKHWHCWPLEALGRLIPIVGRSWRSLFHSLNGKRSKMARHGNLTW